MLALVLAVAMAADPDGLAAWGDRRFAEAEKAFRSALRRRPADRMSRIWLARTLVEMKREPEAIGELQLALTEPVPPEVRFEAGRVLRDLAERRLVELQAIAPESPATMELAGERLEWGGRLDEALAEYRSAATKSPERPGVHYRVGNVLWLKRETDAALAELRKELALTPQHGMANLRVGEVLLQADQAGEAIPYLERAVEAIPESAEARRELGKAYRKAGRVREARSHWEALAKARPNDDQVHYLLGNLYREIGEPALAKTELDKHRAILSRRRRPE